MDIPRIICYIQKETNMKVYIVTIYGGEWEDKWSTIDSIWVDTQDNTGMELAAARVKEIEYNYTQMALEPAPYAEEDYYNELLSEKQDEEFRNWLSSVQSAADFGFVKYHEYETNKP